jgi:hypothetical protein
VRLALAVPGERAAAQRDAFAVACCMDAEGRAAEPECLQLRRDGARAPDVVPALSRSARRVQSVNSRRVIVKAHRMMSRRTEELPMHWKKPIVALSCLGVAAAAAALPALSRATIRGPITLRATETLKRPQPGAHAPTGAGHFTISGAIVDKGTVTQDAERKRRNCPASRGWQARDDHVHHHDLPLHGEEPWTIASGTGAYKGLHGKGEEMLDAWYEAPARFVMKGTVSQ